MLLVWLGALIIGLSLGLLGSGGSILTVPILVYLVQEPQKLAIAESLAIVGGISLLGAIPMPALNSFTGKVCCGLASLVWQARI
jgi:uncharacterized protein